MISGEQPKSGRAWIVFIANFDQIFGDILAASSVILMSVAFVSIAYTAATKGRHMVNAMATIAQCQLIRKRSFHNEDDSYRVVLCVPKSNGESLTLVIDDTTQRYDVGATQPVQYYGPDPQKHFVMTHHTGTLLVLFGLGTIVVAFFAYMHFATR